MGLMETLITLAGGLVSVTVIAGSVAQATEVARLRRREAFYRDAAAAAVTDESDLVTLRRVRREALSRLVAHDLAPLRRIRADLLFGLASVFILATNGRDTMLYAYGEGIFERYSLLNLLFEVGPFVLVAYVMMLQAVRSTAYIRTMRGQIRTRYLAGTLEESVHDESHLPNQVRRWLGTRRHRFVAVALMAVSLMAGQVWAAREVEGDPTRAASGYLLVTMLVAIGSAVSVLNLGQLDRPTADDKGGGMTPADPEDPTAAS